MSGWFLIEAGRAVGPVSRIELEAAVRSGRITPDTLVCEDGDPDWRLARRVPGLVPPRVIKEWQASVTAARKVEPPAPRPPVVSPPSATTAPREAPADPAAAPRAVPAAAAVVVAGPTPQGSLRRPLALVLVVAVAAVGGGILGATLVLKNARVSPTPASEPPPAATSPAAAAAPESGRTGPGDDRPRLRMPPAPAALPAPAEARVAERLASVREQVNGYETAVDAFIAAGGLDASTLPSREALAARMDGLEALRDRNEALRRMLSSLPDDVRARCTEDALAPEVADAAARRARAEVAPVAREREADAEVHAIAEELLSLLDETFGAWSVRPAERAVEFKGEGAADAARRHAGLVEAARRVAVR